MYKIVITRKYYDIVLMYKTLKDKSVKIYREKSYISENKRNNVLIRAMKRKR